LLFSGIYKGDEGVSSGAAVPGGRIKGIAKLLLKLIVLNIKLTKSFIYQMMHNTVALKEY
jgi:hypothetical protein